MPMILRSYRLLQMLLLRSCRFVADISFLLPFLRVRYFSQLEALKLIDNFLTKRGKFRQWFGNVDSADPKIQDVYDRGYVRVDAVFHHEEKCTAINFNNAIIFKLA